MHYYNEYDKNAAAWLRELIVRRLIPAGEVDERSIVEVCPSDLKGFTQVHLFAGVAGWARAFQLAGWPEDKPVWTMSCPCQPFSSAGEQKGHADERHLWPVAFELIKACRPPIVFGEQVASSLVVGKKTEHKQVCQVLDRKIINRVLRQQVRGVEDFLQGLRKSEDEEVPKGALRGQSNPEKRNDLGVGCEVSSQQARHSFRPSSGRHSSADRGRLVRTDGDTFRSENAESMGHSLLGSDQSEGRLHAGQRESGAVCSQCDESQLGTEHGGEDCRSDQESESGEVERLIGETGGEAEEEAPVWLDGIQDDLEQINYACGACVMAASSVGAPHIRQRLYWVAHSKSQRRNGGQSSAGPNGRTIIEVGGTDGRLGNAGCQRDELGRGVRDVGRTPGQEQGEAWERQRSGDASASAGFDDDAFWGMEHAKGDGRQQWRTEPVGRSTARGCGNGERLAHHHHHQGSQGHGRLVSVDDAAGWQEQERYSALGGFWSDYQLVPCRDGKARRIESGSQPLVDGLPRGVVPVGDCSIQEAQATGEARVARLKGFGNAIVPQVAAQFILACEETIA